MVEGTAAKRLKAGPGHDPASALPGPRRSTRSILGKSSSYNKPFAHLGQLAHGDKIIITTGAGRFHVHRRRSTPAGRSRVRAARTLTLATSSPGLLSSGVTTVVAKLDGRPLRVGLAAHRPTTVDPAPTTGFFQDPGAIVAALFWGALLVGALLLAARALSPLGVARVDPDDADRRRACSSASSAASTDSSR